MDCYDLAVCPGTCCSCTVPVAVEAGVAGILCEPEDRADCDHCRGKISCSTCGHEVKGLVIEPAHPIECVECQERGAKDPSICDWTACPHFDGPCCDPSCPGWEMKEAREARRRAVAGMAFICFVACGLLMWVAAHFGGGR